MTEPKFTPGPAVTAPPGAERRLASFSGYLDALGAVWGAVFRFVAHWSTRGQRDFDSVMTLQAQRYDVYVDASHASDAARYQQLD